MSLLENYNSMRSIKLRRMNNHRYVTPDQISRYFETEEFVN